MRATIAREIPTRRLCVVLFAAVLSCCHVDAQQRGAPEAPANRAVTSAPQQSPDEPQIFSGPQPGETLPGFEVRRSLDSDPDRTFNPVADADGKPLLLVFFHKRTRPAFGLTNTLMRYAATRKTDGLHAAAVFLTDDVPADEKWMNNVRQYFEPKVPYGTSPDGLEGPGALGLNRNVTLTVLIAADNKVTANFALLQPSLQVDGPEIAAALARVMGDSEPPNLAATDRSMRQRGTEATGDSRPSGELRALLRPLIDKSATEQQVNAAAARIEEHMRTNPEDASAVKSIAGRIIESGRLTDYGMKAAQNYLEKWAQRTPPQDSARPSKSDDR